MGFSGLFMGVIILIFVFLVVSNIMTWDRNNKAPILNNNAILVDKRKHHHHHGGQHPHSSTSYHLKFLLETGEEMTFKVKSSRYHMHDEGDEGVLTYQGTRFLEFGQGQTIKHSS